MSLCLLYRVYDFCAKKWPERYNEAVEDVVMPDEVDDATYLAKPWLWDHYFDCENDWLTALRALTGYSAY